MSPVNCQTLTAARAGELAEQAGKLTPDDRDELREFIRELHDDIQIAEYLGNLAIAEALKESRRKARRDLRQC